MRPGRFFLENSFSDCSFSQSFTLVLFIIHLKPKRNTNLNELFKSFLRNKTTTRETGMRFYLSMNAMWIFETFKDMFHIKNNQNISKIYKFIWILISRNQTYFYFLYNITQWSRGQLTDCISSKKLICRLKNSIAELFYQPSAHKINLFHFL